MARSEKIREFRFWSAGVLASCVLLGLGACVQAESPLVAINSNLSGGVHWQFQANYNQPTVTLYLTDNGQKKEIGTGDLPGVDSTTTISGEYKHKAIQASCKTTDMGLFQFDGTCLVYIDGQQVTTLLLH